jgi:hypothetical protein
LIKWRRLIKGAVGIRLTERDDCEEDLMDMRTLRPLVEVEAAFASVCFDASHDTQDGAEQLELRWRGLREELEAQGADSPTLQALDKAVLRGEPAVGRAGRALVAAGGRVLVDEWLPEPPPSPVARSSQLPYLLPLAALSEPGAAHVIAVVDRAGADLRVVDESGNDVETDTVTGRDHPLHKVRGGGWAHRRFQKTVEETVRRNMKDVADEITQLADRVGARLIALAGEVQARSELYRLLAPRCQKIAVEVEGFGRLDALDYTPLEQQVRRLVSERADGTPGESDPSTPIQGLSDCVAALREANVETLLVAEPQIHDLTVWTGSVPSQVAVREDELRGLGMSTITRQRADEALPLAALAVGADIRVTDDRLADGVGVLTRHT